MPAPQHCNPRPDGHPRQLSDRVIENDEPGVISFIQN
jgi:hypothetical protein